MQTQPFGVGASPTDFAPGQETDGAIQLPLGEACALIWCILGGRTHSKGRFWPEDVYSSLLWAGLELAPAWLTESFPSREKSGTRANCSHQA